MIEFLCIFANDSFLTAAVMARKQFIKFIRVEFHLVWQHLDYFSPEWNAALIGVIRNTCVNPSLSGQNGCWGKDLFVPAKCILTPTTTVLYTGPVFASLSTKVYFYRPLKPVRNI